MARLARLYAPDTSQLIQVQLSSQVLPEMLEVRFRLLTWIEQTSRHYGLVVHAWSVTQESIFLFCTPSSPRIISSVVQAVGRHLASTLRVGAVFMSRYRSCLVESGEYTLACMVWLESQVYQQEGMSIQDILPWSSIGWHTGHCTEKDTWIHLHEAYRQLGNTPLERQVKYRQLCEEGISAGMYQKIQTALMGQWALGSDDFIAQIAIVANRRVSPIARGRPRRRSK
ncbi:hypothetical protein F9B74_08925 [Pelistega sp. NLN82]|uniref:Transposase n=1 Tax=Pelistega ratti TaxID=2652177 RepID=A0A6L9Y7R1_9BURK|nr:hypothetical protein [Pelistega ratti]NEN76431.1 hypothetical protein [Pelistega ratti]